MERLLCRWEPVYSPVPRSTGVYNQSLHFHAHIRAIKNKSKRAWCKPFVNLMFAGTFWIKKRHFFEDWQPRLNLPPMMTFWQTSQEQFSLPCAVFFLFFSVNMNLYIFTHYHTIRSALRMLICTSINSYLKDKSKHVCFLFVFFSSSQLPKGIYEHFGNKDQRRI